MDVKIECGHLVMEATLFETDTGKMVFDALPLDLSFNTWGDEIYFQIPVEAGLDDTAREEVSEGDLGYWPNMPAFCIFFGPTPVSTGNRPVAASPVNVFGRLLHVDPERLSSIPEGENVVVEPAD